MAKAIVIRLKDENGAIYRWKLERVPRAYNCGGNLMKSRVISGWQFADHDGYQRFVEGSWIDLVPRVKATAANYGFQLCSELS